MRTELKTLLGGAVVIGALLGGVRGCNMAWNNRDYTTPAYSVDSEATGLYGHVEYIKYSDGAQDLKVYPGFAHRMFDSDLFQDLDGDSKVDRIRRNGAEWKMNHLSELLVREHDYDANQDRFDDADALMAKYAEKSE